MLTRIGGLLRQAESTDNPHEADAFLAAAQRLATSASVDLAVARAHATAKERRATPVQRLITIGEAGKKGLRTYAQLFLAIAAANDVQCDITATSTVVYAYGFTDDIDVCEASTRRCWCRWCARPIPTCGPVPTGTRRQCGRWSSDAGAGRSARGYGSRSRASPHA